ncbi:DUF607-domain-containing protein [Xylona heveae TC161]|uniref:Calcium uniporter protein, mitochondrial n=1 Tax=Xylona heveae (strain CBS 132557 / TC161) TaxID=1328760 RepID=A0A164ZKI2_XYLHT|nr:DUF607-domain-containing protein [Xylona heveae TC161]KZF19205.1 DUF607-domain-containing protein [Xylona heveae TC161]
MQPYFRESSRRAAATLERINAIRVPLSPHCSANDRYTASSKSASRLVLSNRISPLRHYADSNYGSCLLARPFSTKKGLYQPVDRYSQQAKDLNQQGLDAQESDFENAIAEEKEKQIRTPWHRQGSQLPPVKRQRQASAMTKGKLLTTPARLLKLILPLTTQDKNSDRKDVEPLALLVHPQQPLSYLERLIQSELPSIKTEEGRDKVPRVWFRAEESQGDEMGPDKREPEDEGKQAVKQDESKKSSDGKDLDETNIDGEVHRTGILKHSSNKAKEMRGGPGEGGVEAYSGLGREAQSPQGDEKKFVRWSSSTEIGDFIRDAARGQEFAVEIEGLPKEIRVGVPSFSDRTYYLRMRLRKTSKKLASMADIKRECDIAAHRGGQRMAVAGFGVMATWWYIVYRLTFETDLGWDTMEPVTYLVGLSTLMGGYLWFLYHNREISYQSALNLTISRRQNKLYQSKGFDLPKWEGLVEEANALRKEIKAVASEYDVDWDETVDEHDAIVTEELKKEREAKESKGDRKKGKRKAEKDDHDD